MTCTHPSHAITQGDHFGRCRCGVFLVHSPCCFGGWAIAVEHDVTECCDCGKRHLHFTVQADAKEQAA